MKKKILSLLLITILSFTLVACDENDNHKSTSNETTTKLENEANTVISSNTEKETTENATSSHISEHDNISKYDVLEYRKIEGLNRAFYVFTPLQAECINGAKNSVNYVTYLGNGSSAEWDIDVKLDGEYVLWVEYNTAEIRDVEIMVNNKTLEKIECTISGGWNEGNTKGFAKNIRLEKGTNTIKLYNDNEYAPDIAWIGVSRIDELANIIEEDMKEYTYYTYNNAVMTSGVTVSTVDMTWYGTEEYVLFDKVKVDKEGSYNLKLEYISSSDFQYVIQINNNEPIVVNCKYSGSAFNYGNTNVNITLNEGVNKIKIQTKDAINQSLYRIGITN